LFQTGSEGPEGGGKAALATWWLGTKEAVFEVVAAAVMPTTTTDRARMRTASFIMM